MVPQRHDDLITALIFSSDFIIGGFRMILGIDNDDDDTGFS